MDKIQSLNEQISRLSHSVDWWNSAIIVMMFVAALAAAGLFVTQYIAVRRAQRLSTAQASLDSAKEAQLKIDLKSKDVEIAQAKEEAGKANKAAEDERMARIQLAASISWRIPDRALVPRLAPPLQPFASQRLAFVMDPSDPERSGVVSWMVILLAAANWRIEPAPASPRSELAFQATNIVLWVSPTAPRTVLEAARALVSALERGGLPAVVLQSGWGPEPDQAPPELIRAVIFRRGPRMTVTGNVITFEGSPTQLLFGSGPPH